VWPEEAGGEGDGYYQFQGTSMASPHVAATGSLLMSQGVQDASRVRDLLERSAQRAGPREKFGAGVLSADRATHLAERWAASVYAKGWAWTFLALPLLLWKKPKGWWRNGRWLSEQWRFGWWLRPAMAFAFWLGAFGPNHFAGWFGANSPLNLLAFSALVPFLLFWELEDAPGSRVVCALSLGIALCLVASCWGGLLSPFTATAFGWTIWPWTLANLAAALIIAGAAWARSEDDLR
jgi:hypothetical protein